MVLFMYRFKKAAHQVSNPSPTPINLTEKAIKRRTKDATPKCGFISCIRVRYRFSFSICKHAFFHYTYVILILLSRRIRRLEILCVTFILFSSTRELRLSRTRAPRVLNADDREESWRWDSEGTVTALERIVWPRSELNLKSKSRTGRAGWPVVVNNVICWRRYLFFFTLSHTSLYLIANPSFPLSHSWLWKGQINCINRSLVKLVNNS